MGKPPGPFPNRKVQALTPAIDGALPRGEGPKLKDSGADGEVRNKMEQI